MDDEYPVTRPVFIYAIIVMGLVAVGGFAYTSYPTFEAMSVQSSLRTDGVAAPARILSVEQTRHRINNDWVFDVEVEVSPEGMKPFWAEVSQRFAVLHVPNLQRGAAVMVKFDPADKQKIVITSTGGSSLPNKPAPEAAAKAAPIDPVCQATTRCCLTAMGTGARASCEGFSKPGMTAPACAAALPTYLAAAKDNGVKCK